jgi:signal transduction histidine kinase
MKIQYKINSVSLGILVAVALAISVAGTLTIEKLSYDINRRLLDVELETIFAYLHDIHRVLEQSGVAKAPSYVRNAQRETLHDLMASRDRRLGRLSVIAPPETVIFHENQDAGGSFGSECLSEMLASTSGVVECKEGGQKRLYYHRDFEPWSWKVILSASTQKMVAMRTTFLRSVLIITVISLVLGGATLVILTKGMVQPLQQLANAALGLSRGDFNEPLPTVRTNDEVAALTRAFKQMADNLAVAHHDLELQTRELVRANKDLSEEVMERKIAEARLEDLNRSLEQLVDARTSELAHKADELERANQQLLKLDEMKSMFLSSVSHELRTPLTSVLGFAKMISKDFGRHFSPLSHSDEMLQRKGQRILANLEIIEAEGARLTRMINDVLDLNRIESGRMEWSDQDVDPALSLQRVASIIETLFAQKPALRFSMDIPDTLPMLRIDPDRFEQVLINLLDNALKFTTEGCVTLSCRYNRQGTLHIQVADTGEGIPPHDLESIFDKFYQVRQDTLRRSARGTGLGLAICKQIVSHYGGRIRVESERGVGSTFHVEFPV